jgi:ubiquinone/menaquinone biosynthesis C-methylase UbiE
MKRRFGIWIWIFVLLVSCLSHSAYAQKREPDILFVPTPQDTVEAMLNLAKVNKNDLVYDLGCGDGRFVITAAKKFGARGIGIDIDPERIRESTENAKKEGVMDRVKFIEADLYETDLHEATVITLYLLPSLNVKLRPKLLSELRPGSRVVSYSFDMEDWTPDTIVDSHYFYYWVIPAKVAGTWQWSLDAETGQQNQLRLEQKYQKIEGHVRFEGKEAKLLEPKLEGDQVSFLVNSESQGQSLSMRFKGRISGDTITGDVDIQRGSQKRTQAWKAARL